MTVDQFYALALGACLIAIAAAPVLAKMGMLTIFYDIKDIGQTIAIIPIAVVTILMVVSVTPANTSFMHHPLPVLILGIGTLAALFFMLKSFETARARNNSVLAAIYAFIVKVVIAILIPVFLFLWGANAGERRRTSWITRMVAVIAMGWLITALVKQADVELTKLKEWKRRFA